MFNDPQAVAAIPHLRCQLGEGPTWDSGTQRLIFVDILAGRVHRWSPTDGKLDTQTFAGEVSAAIPTADGGVLVASGNALIELDAYGTPSDAWQVDESIVENRFNDCRTDPVGRLWAGTMSRNRTPGRAGLYRLGHERHLVQVVGPTTLSNGMGWSPDGSLMYFIDSTTQRIDVFDYDLALGQVARRRPFAHIKERDGLPDGLTVDRDGGVWVCLFGGGRIRRYTAGGRLDEDIPLPVTNPTCPAFGGQDMRTLFVTSARHKLTEGQLATEPLAGAVLSLHTGRRGKFSSPFRATTSAHGQSAASAPGWKVPNPVIS